jgi:murein DD-endopeptidase MepM/ murein hydrolase activator NlpD
MANFDHQPDVNFVILKDEKKTEKIAVKLIDKLLRYCNIIGSTLLYFVIGFFISIAYNISKLISFVKHIFYKILGFFAETGDAITDGEARAIYVMELRVFYKILINKIKTDFVIIFFFAKKLYLLAMVVSIVLGLRVIINYIKPNLNHKSYLNQVFDNYTYADKSSITAPLVAKAVTTTNKEIVDIFPLNKITVKAEDKVEKIAERQNLNIDTVLLNNNLEADKPLPKDLKELIVPWQDGYVYFPKVDISPKELSEKYKVDEKKIYESNEDKVNEKGLFIKDSTIILPTKDFTEIKKAIAKDKAAQAKEEQLKQIKENVSKLASSYNNQFNDQLTGGTKYASSTSEEKRTAGLIWPTKGSISRCIEPGHPGCDIANPNMPPVYAVADGVVIDVYRFTVYGYGNAVVISHGNGLTSLYAHLNEIYAVKGQAIAQGQALGQMGNTGNSTGTHLHIEIKQNGIAQNPLAYLP